MKMGIQYIKLVTFGLDSRLRGNDVYEFIKINFLPKILLILSKDY